MINNSLDSKTVFLLFLRTLVRLQKGLVTESEIAEVNEELVRPWAYPDFSVIVNLKL